MTQEGAACDEITHLNRGFILYSRQYHGSNLGRKLSLRFCNLQRGSVCACSLPGKTLPSTSLLDYDIIKLLTQLRCLGQLCMCSMCRKCGGTGGTVNLGAWSKTLKVTGRQHTTFVLCNRYSILPAKGTARSLTITTLHLARTMLSSRQENV